MIKSTTCIIRWGLAKWAIMKCCPVVLKHCVLQSQVTVLEAKERLGGRVQVSRLASGALLTLGPDIINGSINNPIAMMARQVRFVK